MLIKTLNIRKKKIINILKNSKEPISSKALADDLGCSNKTVQLEIKSINSILKNCKIEALRGSGYIFTGDLYELNDNELNSEEYSESRIGYILHKIILLYNGKALKVETLADELYVSLSTIKNDIKIVKDILRRYNLKVTSKYKQGIGIDGNINDLIKCIMDANQNYNELEINCFLNDFIKTNIDNIKVELLKKLKNENIICTDYVFNSMFSYILLYLSIEDNSNYKKYINSYVSKYKDIIKKKNNESIKSKVLDSIDKCIAELKYISSIDFSRDEIFKEYLCKHLINLFIKSDLNIKMNSIEYDNIKINYPIACDLAKIAKITLEKELDIEINEGEVGNIAIHIGGALQRNLNRDKGRILKTIIICTSGIGTSMIIKAKLEAKFEDRLEIIKVIPSYLVDYIDLDGVDFLITTVPIDIKVVPVIRISAFLDDKEVNLIERFLETEKVYYNINLLEVFNKDLFFTDLEFTDKYDLINYIASRLLEKNYIDEEMKNSYIEREQIATTEIGNMVAIPHGSRGKVFKNSIAIGILKNSINWEIGKVRLVMLLAIERDNILNYEEIFSNIYKRIDSVAKVISICESKKYERFIAMFK